MNNLKLQNVKKYFLLIFIRAIPIPDHTILCNEATNTDR